MYTCTFIDVPFIVYMFLPVPMKRLSRRFDCGVVAFVQVRYGGPHGLATANEFADASA